MSMDIKVDFSKSKLFMAICTIKRHSYLMFGLYDDDGASHVLCRVGKQFIAPPIAIDDTCASLRLHFWNLYSLLQAFFHRAPTGLYDELKVYENTDNPNLRGHSPISYQAYDITLNQYLEFVHFLEALEEKTGEKYYCFKPYEQNGSVISMVYTNQRLSTTDMRIDDLKDNISSLNVQNTCRHSAIKLVESVRKVPVSPLISKFFMRNLPCETALDFGVPTKDKPFYVLPLPPSVALNKSKAEIKVLKKLYQRMEELVLIAPNDKDTVNKFNKLKQLYQKIHTAPQSMSLKDLLSGIQSWKAQNLEALSVMRQKYFWDDSLVHRRSKTIKLVEQIEFQLEAEASLGNRVSRGR